MALKFETSVLISLFVLFVVFTQGDALQCWFCSSDSAAHCQDPFNTTIPPPKFSLVNCESRASSFNSQFQSNQRAVCRKVNKIVRGQPVIQRSCAFENENAPDDECMKENTPTYIKIESCFTCTTDGCNSAPGTLPGFATVLGIVVSAIAAAGIV